MKQAELDSLPAIEKDLVRLLSYAVTLAPFSSERMAELLSSPAAWSAAKKLGWFGKGGQLTKDGKEAVSRYLSLLCEHWHQIEYDGFLKPLFPGGKT